MSEPIAYLFQDAVDHLTDFMGSASVDAEQRILRRSIVRAYEHFQNEKSWNYLYTGGQILLQPNYSTGTVQFDYTGGTYERMLTLTTGTWPSYAKFCRIRINNVVYEVDDRKSNSVITLTEGKNPGQDITTDTTYNLYQNVYQLPADFRRLCTPQTYNNWWSFYISPKDWQWQEWHCNNSGDPVRWTIAADPDRVGGYACYVDPHPASAANFDFMYQRAMRSLRYTGYDSASRTGTVSNTGTAVTGSGTSFTSAMIGSYLRISTTSGVPDGLGGLNPYAEQRKIRAVASTTALTLDAAPDSNYSAVGFCISDPLDMPQGMVGAFLRCVEWQYSMLGRVKDKDAMQAMQQYAQALTKAVEFDNVAEISRSLGGGSGPYSDRGFETATTTYAN